MAPTADKVPHIYKALAEVRKDINAAGIMKGDEATDGMRFSFRGIDRVLNAFSGPMAKAGMMILPTYSEATLERRQTKSGGTTFNYLVTGSFRAISTEDGSEIMLGSFYGEANDTQDKAVAKAQSIALRQAYLQTFSVPLGPDMDPENGDSAGDQAGDPDPEPRPAQPAPQSKSGKKETQPRQVQGEVQTPLAASQERILKARLEAKGIKREVLVRDFGEVYTSNFNEAVAWIKDHD